MPSLLVGGRSTPLGQYKYWMVRLERLGVQSKQCSVEVNVEVDAVLFLACSTRQIEYSAGSWLYDSMAMTQDGNGCDSGIDGCMEKLFPVKQTEERVWK